ncbi:MAG: DNA-deoxyinosine glycosylase [Candidatus Omnitrophota bacterium]
MPKRVFCFPLIINKNSKVLILGSFPGITSRRKNEYYGHSRNSFWKLVFDLLEEGIPSDDYRKKIRILKKHRVGLWDVVASCGIQGSSDSDIKEYTQNDIDAILKKYKNIKAIFANGKKAYKILHETLRTKIHLNYLPSTSPAHTMPFKDKKDQWKKILKYIQI